MFQQTPKGYICLSQGVQGTIKGRTDLYDDLKLALDTSQQKAPDYKTKGRLISAPPYNFIGELGLGHTGIERAPRHTAVFKKMNLLCVR